MQKIPALFVLVCGLGCPGAFAQVQNNLLRDTGFEEGVHTPLSTNWSAWGGATVEPLTPRNGAYAAKLWGNNASQWNYSGLYQDAVVGGGAYEASAYMRQNSDDHLRGENSAFIKLEFYGGDGGQQLMVHKSAISLHAKSPSKKYVFISTGRIQAPPETKTVRFVVVYAQDPANSAGAVLVDDAALRQVP